MHPRAENAVAPDETLRISREYARRAQDPRLAGLYSATSPGNLHMTQSLERAILGVFRAHGLEDFGPTRLLDVGCGCGGNLWRFLGYGFQASNCAGIELLPERAAGARKLLPPEVDICQGNACRLPFESERFDVVTQFTVFSSILEDTLCKSIAREMLRVVTSRGLILSYDFWLNPFNKHTRGVTPRFLRGLFPGAACEFHRITLAPPIVRRVARFSWPAATLLEGLRLFNTHYLAVIRKTPA